jgi:hypothetical protein
VQNVTRKNNIVELPDLRLRQLRHVILPGQCAPGFSSIALYNSVFNFWHAFWINVLKGNGSSEEINPYDFLRSGIISCILHHDTVVAVHLYSILNFEQDNIIHHPYLRGEHEQCFVNAMKDRRLKTAMPLEFLTVNPEWRKSVIGFHLAPVLVGLGYQIQKNLGIDATLGRCRTDVKSNVLMTDVGGVTLKSNVMMHNTPVDFCALFLDEMKPHPDPKIQSLIEYLWNSRTDHSGVTSNEETNEKRSA